MSKPLTFRCCRWTTWSCCRAWWCRSLSDHEARAAIEAAQVRRPPAGDPPTRPRSCWCPAGRQVSPVSAPGRRRADRPAARRRARRRRARHRPGPDRHRHDRPGRGAVGRGHGRRRDRPRPPGRRAGPGVQGAGVTILQQRGAWQIVDSVQQHRRPVRAGRHRRLRAVPDRRAEGRAARDRRRGRAARAGARAGPASTWPSWTSPRRSARTSQEGMEKQQREFLLRQQLAAIRKELGE